MRYLVHCLLLVSFATALFAAPAESLRAEDNAELERQAASEELHSELQKLQKELLKENSIWIKSYDSYKAYRESRKSLIEVKNRIKQLQNSSSNDERKLEHEALQAKEKILTEQIALLKAQGSSPFVLLLKPDEAGETPHISNPFQIVVGLSYIKRLSSQYQDYLLRKEDLQAIIDNFAKQIALYEKIVDLSPSDEDIKQFETTKLKAEKFKLALDTLTMTADVYEKRIESTEAKIDKEIKEQLYKLFTLFIVVVVLLLIVFFVKRAVKHYVVDNERFYMVNKIVTIVYVSLIVLVALFSYIDNVGYFATVLGFASAGIAIAMRDWFMSVLGWLVIILGGSIHVGDRIRVEKDGMIYLGDVLDISFQRMTMLEDVTLTTIEHNRRAGRIIFVPNNYIFTSLIANYTHGALKTVWDGIDIIITFDSNHKKAAHLAKEVCRKYSKGYTDITRKQLNKLRDKYSLKNTNVEPRIFTFIEPNGIKISSWYLTSAHATLTLRSTISADLIDVFNAEYDIAIAYPTQTLYTGKIPPKSVPPMEVS